MQRMKGQGICINRDREVEFRFNGARLVGYRGDTIASAILANGITVVGRSFKYHRRRGFVANGAEEPNGLVNVVYRGVSIPNVLATRTSLEDGMVIDSQNAWPTVRFDIAGAVNFLYRFFPAGFYYKTFMWPRNGWKVYERVLRRMAGLGKPPSAVGTDVAYKVVENVDVLIVGAGVAGLSAALAAAAHGQHIVLVDQGGARGTHPTDMPPWYLDAAQNEQWMDLCKQVLGCPNVQVRTGTTLVGAYDHNYLVLLENIQSFGADERRVVAVRAKKVVYATGAMEQLLPFRNNDVPGVMLAGAVAEYFHQYGVACGRGLVFFVNNDQAYNAIFFLDRHGVKIDAVVDTRRVAGCLKARLGSCDIDLLECSSVIMAVGTRKLTGVLVTRADGDTGSKFVSCEVLAVSGGWIPLIHLPSQSRLPIEFDQALQAFIAQPPAESTIVCAGACRGLAGFDASIADGRAAMKKLYSPSSDLTPCEPRLCTMPSAEPVAAVFDHESRVFIDMQNDVTVKDIVTSVQEGYRSIEHLKRFTTLGMGTDQGKLGNMPGLRIFAGKLGKPLDSVGLTTFRPPFVSVPISSIVAHRRTRSRHPARCLSAHNWHCGHDAVFSVSTPWLRPRLYPRPGESESQAISREALSVRKAVGVMDVSPLGKIDIRGENAIEFVNRVYANELANLAVGKSAYAVLLREDGVIRDDGVVSRLGEHHVLASASTSVTQVVYEQILFYATVVWPDLLVSVNNLSEQYGGVAVAGPRSRELLARLDTDIELSEAFFPNMSVRMGRVSGLQCMVTRFSFSGELAYEINVGCNDVPHLLQAVAELDDPEFPVCFYGTEAMNVLRVEKGHCVTGREIDGHAGPFDLGMGRLLKTGALFVGSQALNFPGFVDGDRRQLVAIVAEGPIPSGGHIVTRGILEPQESLGVVTSQCFSPHSGKFIGLALVQQGLRRIGEPVYVSSPVEQVIVAARIFDKKKIPLSQEGTHAKP